MNRFEAGERILEISEEMQELLREAMGLLSEHGTDLDYQRARSYWYGHIMIALGGDHGYMSRSPSSMIGTAEDLMEEGDDERTDATA
jgi:hypothetical protein